MDDASPSVRNDLRPMGNADELRAYHAARQLQGLIIEMVRAFERVPPDFKSQLLRAARSVPSSITEGFGRGTLGEGSQGLRGLRLSRGSLDEVRHDLRTRSFSVAVIQSQLFSRSFSVAVSQSPFLQSPFLHLPFVQSPVSAVCCACRVTCVFSVW